MKYLVEYYACTTQTDTVEAESEEDAKKQILGGLESDYDMLGRPTDWMFGIRDVVEVEEDEEETD